MSLGRVVWLSLGYCTTYPWQHVNTWTARSIFSFALAPFINFRWDACSAASLHVSAAPCGCAREKNLRQKLGPVSNAASTTTTCLASVCTRPMSKLGTVVQEPPSRALCQCVHTADVTANYSCLGTTTACTASECTLPMSKLVVQGTSPPNLRHL